MTLARNSLDAAWKDSLRLFFPHFLKMFHPGLASQADPSRPIRLLEQELRRIQRRAKVGKRLVDVLVELPLLEGGEAWLLVHVEVQGRKDPEFPHRMWVYHYRAYDLYRRPVVSLAILADSSPLWKPSCYQQSNYGCNLSFEFPAFKLLELRSQLDDLESSDNPFALVVASHLRAQETNPDSAMRLDRKVVLCRRLLNLGLSRDEVDGLFLIIDVILILESKLEYRFDQEVQKMENATELTVPNRWLEKGIKQGHKQGDKEAREEIAQRMIALDFELEVISKATGFPVDEIECLKANGRGD
jgi:hypothetical protein